MTLVQGQQYTKADFGITSIEKRWSEITVEGELFTFFSITSNYDNFTEKDGFVYEGRGSYALIPENKKVDLHRYVFLKEKKGANWTYLGKGKYETRYDKKHNKIFW
jgi:hypothetical protein